MLPRRTDPLFAARAPRPAAGLLLLLAGAGCRAASAGDSGEPVLLATDGGWCWFQDERALVHEGRLVLGSVASGYRDPERRGDVQVTVWDLAGGAPSTHELHDRLELDDHAAPALLVRPDGRILAVYSRHGSDDLVRSRVSKRPGDASDWGPEHATRVDSAENGVTYSNLFLMASADGGARILDFHRGHGWDPNWLVSADGGETWSYGGRLLGGPGRPYLKYASDGSGAIHFIATEQHPRDFDNGLYHGVLIDGRVLRSDGTAVRAGDDGIRPEELTTIFRGAPDAVAWPVDLELDRAGRPCAIFSVQRDGAGLPPGRGGMDHRYFRARWDGRAWSVDELAFAGTRLYAGEDDYTGLAALDPEDPDVVFVSTDAHPTSGRPLVSAADGERHHEIFRGVSGDGGATWSWEAITRDSPVDNLRPVVPRGSPGRTVLVWLRGTYRRYTDYELEVVGRTFPR